MVNNLLKAEIVKRLGSQAEFARIIGEHEPVVSRVIRGRDTLTDEDAKKWAEALGGPMKIFKVKEDGGA